MNALRTTSQLEHIEDAELAQLAVEWRMDALRGNRKAFGIAHALEVEHRRRQRPSQMDNLVPIQTAARPWWKLWPFKSSTKNRFIAGR